MLSFEEAGRILDREVEALPDEIFKNLNGGINLLPDKRRGDDGRFTLGLYHHGGMGRYIEIFYGSFLRCFDDLTAEKFAEELKKTLHHELTHHIENMAGDRTLEKWDEEQKAIWEAGEPLEAESILFLDGDDTSLAPAARLMFLELARERCPEVTAGSAGLDEARESARAEAVKAAAALGADISAHRPSQVTRGRIEMFDAVLCMTLSQADALAERFPEYDEKIMCFAETDIGPPKTKLGWGGVMKRIKKEAERLVDELCEEKN